MQRLRGLCRTLLILLAGFLALTAVPGGVLLVAGLYAPPLAQLRGTPVSSYVVPGLTLCVVVGGGGVAAVLMLMRSHRLAPVAAALAGVAVMAFEFVEVLTIVM